MDVDISEPDAAERLKKCFHLSDEEMEVPFFFFEFSFWVFELLLESFTLFFLNF
jgi:hypothetical protein